MGLDEEISMMISYLNKYNYTEKDDPLQALQHSGLTEIVNN